ncbi:hypothetical protein MVES1_001551 [Malassezia vespertilionis]|uniref:uncharacterized protein n=1 Tax=Malassezia vespertilionis TaxID=2020962 RepID=UPI0024B0C032|nr:uncharacterized protein MVES1_001551 [Malassezia vespertilionis]WFD06209.1 hypothetical protein MVES1_001551 [Malassezia vespertilionis]
MHHLQQLWKARVSAYEELARTFAQTAAENDPVIAEYVRQPDVLRAMVLDANAAAQEKGVEAVKAFVQYGGRAAGTTREAVLPALAEKCLGSMRTGTRNASLELLMLYIEKEDAEGCDGALENITATFSAKQPKTVAANVAAVKDIVRDFGTQHVNVRGVVKRIPDIFAHADKNVRAEGVQLAIELHKYMGPALTPILSQLKDIQAKELEARFAEADQLGDPRTTRFLVSHQPTEEPQAVDTEAAEEAETLETELSAAPSPVDPYEMVEPVDVLQSKKLKPNVLTLLTSSKWQERLEALESLHAALTESPRLVPDPGLEEYVQALQLRLQKDVNINVAMQTCRCLEALADGLCSDGARYLFVLPCVLEKLKERKPAHVETVSSTLDALFRSGTLSDVLDPIQGVASHKNPAVRAGAMRFLARCLQNTTTMPNAAELKAIATNLLEAMNDGAGDVRDAGATGLGTLRALVGERPIAAYMETLDDIKKAKVEEEAKHVTVKAVKAAGGKAAEANAPKANAPKANAPKADAPRADAPRANAPKADAPKANAPNANAPKAKPLPKPHQVPTPPRPNGSSLPKAGIPSQPSQPAPTQHRMQPKASVADDRVKFKHSPEDAEPLLEHLVPTPLQTQLASTNWKERLDGAQALSTFCTTHAETLDTELYARFLAKRPGWKESNFQVLGEIYRSLQTLAQHSPTFGRACAALTIPPLCEKLGDAKLKSVAGETLLLYAEATGLGFVLLRAMPTLQQIKAPKAQADAIAWFEHALLAFGTPGVDIRATMQFLLACLKSANAGVRGNASKAVGSLAKFCGSSLTSLLSDLNPQLRASLEAEIAANAGNAPSPTRLVRGATCEPSATPDVPTAVPTTDAPLDDALEQSIPRADIDAILPKPALAQLNDVNWKVRKESIEAVQHALEAHPRLKGSLANLVAPLKPRFADTNIMVRMSALAITTQLAAGMRASFEPYARALVPPVVQVLADAKVPLRAAAASALTAMYEHIGLAPMVPPMGPVLDGKSANPTLRQDLYTWLLERMESAVPDAHVDLSALAPSVIASLDDRAGGVRKAAQTLLPFLVARTGYQALVEQCSTLKPASRTTAMPLLDAARTKALSLGAPAVQRAPLAKAAPRARLPAPQPALAPRTPMRQSTAVNRALRAPASVQTAAPAAAPPAKPALFTSDARHKLQREKSSGRVLFVAVDGTIRPAHVDQLEQQMAAAAPVALVASLFCKEHEYLGALATLLEFLNGAQLSEQDVAERAAANADLLVKYVCLRLLDKNTSVALKSLEVLTALQSALVRASYHFTDTEALALFLALVQKMGDVKAVFRERVREHVRTMTLLFPPSRLFSMLLEHGTTSKNARTRAESLQEIEYLFAKHGLAVCTPPKAFPHLAKLIGDRDSAVRQCALQVLAEAFKLGGNAVWQMLGPLPLKDESMLAERLKRTAAHASPRAESKSALPVPKTPKSARRSMAEALPHEPLQSASPKSDDFHALAAQIQRGDVDESICALKHAQELIQQGITAHALGPLADAMVLALERAEGAAEMHPRYSKHALQTVLVMLEAQRADAMLTASAVQALLFVLLTCLLHVAKDERAEAQTLSKHLNAVVLRVLSTCDANAVFAASFALLADATKDMEALHDAALDRATRYAELVIKCLWKIARKLPGMLQAQQVHCPSLLATVEHFLQAMPPVEWGRRAQRHVALRDIPLITATNVLKQVIDALGEEALTMLDTLLDPEGSHVYRYLLRLLYAEEIQQEAEVQPERAPPQEDAKDTQDAQTATLRRIFDRISQKDQSRAAIRELYEFQKLHPNKQSHIDRSLQKTGPIFQRYIKRALANHTAEDTGERLASASTPPNGAVDTRLAELKAKFRIDSDQERAPDRSKRMSMSTEALRQRLASMRTE